jgi:glucose-6-phosphate 1-dehydrogenase
VQNLAVFRFANGIFEPIWDRRYIDHVQITVAETLGVENRAGTYEQAGAVRDMVQNHLLQLLCLVAMEPPVSFAAEPVRQEKLKVLQSVRPLAPGAMGAVAVRGQYGPGAIDGQSVAGYRQEPGVAANSGTETFAVLRLEINNWRWAGVPLYLRTGKRLRRKSSEISIEFREAPLELFACTAMKPCEPNLLRLRIQPEEGIGLRVIAKTPGLEVIGHSVEMDYRYGARFEAETPSAYETLLLDCLQGEGMLFAAGDWIETAWDLLTPLLEAWASEPAPDFPNYAAGSWGPRAAEEFLARTGRRWHFE